MKTISLRAFQLNANKYLNELPLRLTRYNKIVAIVNKSDNEGTNARYTEEKHLQEKPKLNELVEKAVELKQKKIEEGFSTSFNPVPKNFTTRGTGKKK